MKQNNTPSINRIELVAQTSYPVIKGCQSLTPRAEQEEQRQKRMCICVSASPTSYRNKRDV